jgi:ABC-2 type transport system permease protein
MSKIPVILRREYLSRVKKKSFLVTTILLPIGLFGLMGLIAFFTVKSKGTTKIGIVDETSVYFSAFKKNKKSFEVSAVKLQANETAGELASRTDNDIILHIYSKNSKSVDSVKAQSESSISLSASEFMDNEIQRIYRKKALEAEGINEVALDSITSSKIRFISTSFEDKITSTGISVALGYGMGFLMYMLIFIYGVGVMRGVMEEKTNRIAEVIISSVSPFELMMGKIIGIGLVGLTQFAIWMGLMTLATMIAGPFILPSAQLASSMADPAMLETIATPTKTAQLFENVLQMNWGLIISSFVLYFIGGYFLYAALFAAVGSLVNEDPQDAQQLTLPISLPIIFALVIMATSLDDPDSGLAVFGSIFPLTSPIVMLGRIPYDPPMWQVGLSLILLFTTFVFITWVSAKIYRTGILLYGKKVGWKEIIKWLRKS